MPTLKKNLKPKKSKQGLKQESKPRGLEDFGYISSHIRKSLGDATTDSIECRHRAGEKRNKLALKGPWKAWRKELVKAWWAADMFDRPKWRHASEINREDFDISAIQSNYEESLCAMEQTWAEWMKLV